jgi:hypothetical protein
VTYRAALEGDVLHFVADEGDEGVEEGRDVLQPEEVNLGMSDTTRNRPPTSMCGITVTGKIVNATLSPHTHRG